MIRIDRWLVGCDSCGRKFMQNGATAPTEHDCPTFGTDARRKPTSVLRVVWRAPAPGADDCRAAEPRHIPPIVDEPGKCGWNCRGSRSPVCRCAGCKGQQHGITQLCAPAASGADVMDTIIGRTAGRDWPRKGRRST